MEKFQIKEKSHEFELSYGSYQIYFTGGWYIKNLEDIDIKLIDVETNKIITLKSPASASVTLVNTKKH